MATLQRPDGAELYWEETGDGPTVVVCGSFNPGDMSGLLDHLRSSRRLVTYHPRGVARSSRGGPYDLDTGAADLEALLEHAGPANAALGVGDGAHRALRVAARRPDLIDRVVATSTSLGELDHPGFSGSAGVTSVMMNLIQRDYRAGLRSMIGADLEDEVMVRRMDELMAMVPHEAAVGYLESWTSVSLLDEARSLGSRLTVLAYPGNNWFPLAMYEALRDALTEACFELADDGPVNRPDQTAAVLVRVSEPATA